MASLNGLQQRALAAQTTGVRAGQNTSAALRLIHVGTNAVTSATVNAGTLVLVDTDGTTATTETITLATVATLGGLVDAINATVGWKAKILDGLRSTVTTVASSLLPVAALTANVKNGELGYDIFLSTPLMDVVAARATYDRTAGNLAPKGGHRVKLVSIGYYATMSAVAAGGLKVIEWDPVLKTETEIWSALPVTATATAFDFSKAPITAKEGNDLVVYMGGNGNVTDEAAVYMQILYVRE